MFPPTKDASVFSHGPALGLPSLVLGGKVVTDCLSSRSWRQYCPRGFCGSYCEGSPPLPRARTGADSIGPPGLSSCVGDLSRACLLSEGYTCAFGRRSVIRGVTPTDVASVAVRAVWAELVSPHASFGHCVAKALRGHLGPIVCCFVPLDPRAASERVPLEKFRAHLHTGHRKVLSGPCSVRAGSLEGCC